MAASLILGPLETAGFCEAAEPIQAHLARRIIGRTVENYDGEKLGKVKDFIVEMQSGQIQYVIISSGGIAGLNSILKPVPPRAVSLATAKKSTVALGGSKVRWEKAPTIRRRELASLSGPSRLRAIYEFYGQQPPLSQTGVEHGRSAAAGGAGALQFASDLIGSTVVNRQQEKIGKVSDLLVDLSGQKPAYAIVSAKFTKTERTFAVPLARFSLPVRTQMVVDASRGQFEQAKLFDQQTSKDASSSTGELYLFPDKDKRR